MRVVVRAASVVVLSVLLMARGVGGESIELETPRGGWIDSGLEDNDEVHAT